MARRVRSGGPSRPAASIAAANSAEFAQVLARSPLVDIGKIVDKIGKARRQQVRVNFVRPDDLLVCNILFDNMRLDSGKAVRTGPYATLVLEFPPQSFGEEAFLDATGPEVTSDAPAGSKEKYPEKSKGISDQNTATTEPETHGPLPFARIRMAGRSRVAFRMPSDESEIELTADAVLDACLRWPMALDVNAAPEALVCQGLLGRFGVLTKDWLEALTVEGSWKAATEHLVGALDRSDEAHAALQGAARRVTQQAIEVTGARNAEQQIRAAMKEELDVLAHRFGSLRDTGKREVATAALSMLSAQAFAQTKAVDTLGEAFIDNPFLHIIFAPHEPADTITALELPYRVILSPIPDARWRHAKAPVSRHGRTELWHTRLSGGSAPLEPVDPTGRDPPAKVRALWSPDYRDNPLDPGIINIVNNHIGSEPTKFPRMSLDPLDRLMLVKLMGDYTDSSPHFTPCPADSNRLSLSALGALLDVEGGWQHLPIGVSLEQWKHMATLGRDHYVRVVYRGFLCHPRHAASLVKVTERKFEPVSKDSSNRVAVLRQRFFIIVREAVRTYDGMGHAFGGRNFPFKQVEILTRVTPSLLDPGNAACSVQDPGKIYSNIPKRACFWPMVADHRNFVFKMAGTDICGDRVTFEMPLLFVGKEANDHADPDVMKQIIQAYNAEKDTSQVPQRRLAPTHGKPVCYAEKDDTKEGDPKLPTQSIYFMAGAVDKNAVGSETAHFYPEIEKASVGIAAVQRLLQKPDAMVDVTYPEVYKNNGFSAGANPGEVFLKTIGNLSLDFGSGGGASKSDALGGLATPSMTIQGLSRIMGPVGGKVPADPNDPAQVEQALKQVIGNKFDPGDFFGDARILGGIKLKDLLKEVYALAKPDAPKLLSKQLPDRVEASFDWKTTIKDTDPLGLFMPGADGKETTLEMRGVVSAFPTTGKGTTFQADATIDNFKVNLFGFITIWFDALAFHSKSGSKPDVAVDLHPTDTVMFGGPLEFVNTLKDIIPANGFSDPPNLTVTPSGISAGYSLNIPTLAVGIFAMEHISLGAGFQLPFDGSPVEVRFNFCERQRPFSLTVSLLGGGGFFAIGIGTEGVREIEAAIEFGAALSINLGVASGSVEIKAGVYFHWKQKSVELAGYVRLHGELSVLGLISASLTFNLQLAFLKETGHSVVWGEATLEVEIEILFFSASVSVHCRREFAGSDGDPKFKDLIPNQATWAEYCGAFALEA